MDRLAWLALLVMQQEVTGLFSLYYRLCRLAGRHVATD